MKAEQENLTEEKREGRFGVSLNELLARQDLQPATKGKEDGVWSQEKQSVLGS